MFLSTLTSGEEAWIGGQQDNVGVWSWCDGRSFNFTSWATGRVDTRYIIKKGITFFWWPIPEIGDISPVQRYYLQLSDISISITVHPYGIPISGIE